MIAKSECVLRFLAPRAPRARAHKHIATMDSPQQPDRKRVRFAEQLTVEHEHKVEHIVEEELEAIKRKLQEQEHRRTVLPGGGEGPVFTNKRPCGLVRTLGAPHSVH